MKYYPGNKKIYGVYHKIINNIPKHKFYYELFAGSASIYNELILSVSPGITVNYTLNDIDSCVTDRIKPQKNTTVINCNASILIEKLASAGTDTFIFMDPPYLHSTRPHSKKLYNYEMTDNDHLQLLRSVLQLQCNVMIIHPKCKLYNTILNSWHKVGD